MDPRYAKIGKDTRFYTDLRPNLKLILAGVVISIDPSAGSGSSQPAYAVYRAGELVACDILDIVPHRPLWERLTDLSRKLRNLYKLYDPDVIAFEDIAPQRYGGGNAEAHATLLKSVGVVLSVPGPRAYIRLSPIVWKRLVRPEYVKGDRQDAEEIGYITIEAAKYISQEDPPRGYKKSS